MATTRIITAYWQAALDGSMDDVDFGEFFDTFRTAIKAKLSAHGQLGFEDYLSVVKKYHDLKPLHAFVYHGKHSHIEVSYDEVVRAIFEPRYKQFKRKYSSTKTYRRLSRLYTDLQDAPYPTRAKNVILAERCIHAQHLSGDIIKVDIVELRERMDRLSWDPSFGILTRPAIEMKLRKMRFPLTVIFIDINDLHRLNRDYGYESINKAVRKALSYFDTGLIGRWFCGDEIIILPGSGASVKLLRMSFHNIGLSFKHRTIAAKSFEDIARQIGKTI